MKKIVKVFLPFFVITAGWLNGENLISEDFLSVGASSSELTQDLDLPVEEFLNKHPDVRFFLFSDEAHKLVNFSRSDLFWQVVSVAVGYSLFKISFTESRLAYTPTIYENALAGFTSQMICARIAGKHVSLKAYLLAAGACIACDLLKGN